MLPREFVKYQDKLYWVYRKHKQTSIKEGYVNDLKEFWNCDVVVRNKMNNDDILLFLRLVEDVEEFKPLI